MSIWSVAACLGPAQGTLRAAPAQTIPLPRDRGARLALKSGDVSQDRTTLQYLRQSRRSFEGVADLSAESGRGRPWPADLLASALLIDVDLANNRLLAMPLSANLPQPLVFATGPDLWTLAGQVTDKAQSQLDASQQPLLHLLMWNATLGRGGLVRRPQRRWSLVPIL